MRDGLECFGYTAREASFLELSSLLSGYFLRRHFNTYIGKSCGAVGQNFLERGLALKHLRSIPALGGRVIYHIASSAIYEALGEPTSRNRREHQFETVRLRVMALDFALRIRTNTEPLTEQCKVEHFGLIKLGVPLENLPHSEFRKCKRFFVDEATPLRVERRKPAVHLCGRRLPGLFAMGGVPQSSPASIPTTSRFRPALRLMSRYTFWHQRRNYSDIAVCW